MPYFTQWYLTLFNIERTPGQHPWVPTYSVGRPLGAYFRHRHHFALVHVEATSLQWANAMHGDTDLHFYLVILHYQRHVQRYLKYLRPGKFLHYSIFHISSMSESNACTACILHPQTMLLIKHVTK